MGPLSTAREGARGVRFSKVQETGDGVDRERFRELKRELDRQQWFVSFNMLALALLDVKNAFRDSAHLPNKKALWSEVFQCVRKKLPFRAPAAEEESEILARLGGQTGPLKGELRALSAALREQRARDPPRSAVRRPLFRRLRRWFKLPPEPEGEPPLRAGAAQKELQQCLELSEALSRLQRKVSKRLRDADPRDLRDLEEELGVLRQRCENQTNEVLSWIDGALKNSAQEQGVRETRGATTEAPEQTPKTGDEPTGHISVTIDPESAAEARCELLLPLDPHGAPSCFQGFWDSVLFWRLTAFLFFTLSLIEPVFLLPSHNPPSKPSSRIQTSHGRDDWMPSMNKYFWNQVETSWDMSSRLCVENGGRLAVLHDELKMNEIFKEYGRRYPWIGLNKSDEDFQWIDGFPFNANMTPVSGFGECAYLRKDGISLYDCSMRRSSLCRREQYG
ncbi:uncharacterized protein LOC144769899 [Lissotriton helveticus]